MVFVATLEYESMIVHSQGWRCCVVCGWSHEMLESCFSKSGVLRGAVAKRQLFFFFLWFVSPWGYFLRPIPELSAVLSVVVLMRCLRLVPVSCRLRRPAFRVQLWYTVVDQQN